MATGFDWTGDEAYKQYLTSVTAGQPGAGYQAPGMAPAAGRGGKKAGRKRAPAAIAPAGMLGAAGAPAQQSGGKAPITATAPTRGGAPGGMMAPGGGGGGSATAPSIYTNAVGAGTMQAPAGSLASRVSDFQRNPEALPMMAISPTLQADMMLDEAYGLPGGSRTSQIFADYLNPREKAYGLLGTGDLPGNNIDWVNFGEQLMGIGKGGFGAQLDPAAMIGNMVSAVMAETNAAKKGGSGVNSDGTYSPLAEMANMNPAEGVNAFVSMARGVLSGTMPDDQLQGYLSWLARIAGQFASEYVTGDLGQMEGAGKNWMSALVQKLGPQLGLG